MERSQAGRPRGLRRFGLWHNSHPQATSRLTIEGDGFPTVHLAGGSCRAVTPSCTAAPWPFTSRSPLAALRYSEWPPRSHSRGRGSVKRPDPPDHPAQANAAAHAPSLRPAQDRMELARSSCRLDRRRPPKDRRCGCDEGRRWMDFGGRPGPQIALGALPASTRIALRLEARQQALSQDDQRRPAPGGF
jgi:hypothetical protein